MIQYARLRILKAWYHSQRMTILGLPGVWQHWSPSPSRGKLYVTPSDRDAKSHCQNLTLLDRYGLLEVAANRCQPI